MWDAGFLRVPSSQSGKSIACLPWKRLRCAGRDHNMAAMATLGGGSYCGLCVGHRNCQQHLLLDAVEPLLDLIEIPHEEPIATGRTEDDGKLAKWRSDVTEGKMPDFGPT